MNEVTRIHLGRQQFVVAVDAHKALQQYLHAIERQVGNDPELTKEVELRMAELLTERGIGGEKVVLAEDITYLRAQLGEPSAFGGEEDGEPAKSKKETAKADEAETPGTPKRLFRDTDNAMLAGVGSGLAAFFGIDAIIVRLLFIVVTLTGGAGILIYILLWILMPEAKTPSEKLQMRGKAVTVDTLKELVDRADVPGVTRRAGSYIEPLFLKLWRIFLGICGVVLLLAAIAGLMGIGSIAVHLLVNHDALVAGVWGFPEGTAETVFAGAVLGLAALIMVLLFCAGLSMLRRKWVLSSWATASIATLMLAALVVGGALVQHVASRVEHRYNSSLQEVAKPLKPFDEIILQGRAGLRYEPGNTYKVVVTYHGKAPQSAVRVTQNGNRVVIDVSDISKYTNCERPCILEHETPEVVVHAPRPYQLVEPE